MKAIYHEYTEEQYDDALDEIYGEVEIAGYKYPTSQALKEIDPTAYRCGMNDMEGDQWECSECNTLYESEKEANECCA